MNVREQFITYLHERGWLLDTEATAGQEPRQDPHAFVRRAADGKGTWHLLLDYIVEGGWQYRHDNTLRGLRLTLVPDSTDPETPAGRNRSWRMENTARTTYDPHNLWQVTGRDIGNDYGRALRMRAERVGADPDMVVWLAMEEGHRQRQAQQQAEERRRAEYEARTRPNPAIGVAMDDWRRRVYTLKRKTEALYQADGQTDVPALLAELEAALEAVRAATTKNDPA